MLSNRHLQSLQPKTTRGARPPNRRWDTIHPPTLMQEYREPALALAAAIVQQTAEDIRRDDCREECFAFLRSDWFSLIARSLDFRPETLSALRVAG